MCCPPGASDDDTSTVEQIVQQMVANDQCSALTNSQRARATQQMLDTGMSATKIAKKLSMRREDVKAAGAVSKSTAALGALDDGQTRLHPSRSAHRVRRRGGCRPTAPASGPVGGNNFEHTAPTLCSEREISALIADAEKEYTERGYTILQDRPRWSDMSADALNYLRIGDDVELPAEFERKPEHWTVYLTDDCACVDNATGEAVGESDIDLDTENDEDAVLAEGMRHVSTITEKTVIVPERYCLN